MAHYSAFMMWTNTLVPQEQYQLGRLRRHWPRSRALPPGPGIIAPPSTPVEDSAPLVDLIALNNLLLATLPESPRASTTFYDHSSLQATPTHLSLGSGRHSEISSPQVVQDASLDDPFRSSQPSSAGGDGESGEWEDVSTFSSSPDAEGTPIPNDPYDQTLDHVAGLSRADQLEALRFRRAFQGRQEEEVDPDQADNDSQIQAHRDQGKTEVGRFGRVKEAMRRVSDKLHDILTKRETNGNNTPTDSQKLRAASTGDPFRRLRGAPKPESERRIRQRLMEARQMSSREADYLAKVESAAGRRLADRFGQREWWRRA